MPSQIVPAAFLLSLSLVALVAGCGAFRSGARQAVAPDVAAAPAPSTGTFVFECDGYEFVARVEDEHVWLFLPGKTVRVPQVPSASGARYSDGRVVFWSKGEQALLEVGEVSHRGCRNDRARAVWEDAKLRGADFRAVGNEPGWFLEILYERRIVLVTDYGLARDEFENPERTTDRRAARTVYHARREARPRSRAGPAAIR